MKTWITYFAFIVTAFVLLLCSLRLHSYYQYAFPLNNEEFFDLPNKNDTLKVAFIGDSWAVYHHQYDSLLCSMLNVNDHFFSVISKGNVGAKSMEIYQRMSTSTKPVIDARPDYCVISAGINDAVAKMGKVYYVHHYMLILHHLVRMGITPVVLEIPDVNFRAIAGRERWTMRLHHCLSALICDSEMYGFESYRAALWNAINNNRLSDSIIYVKAEQWNPEGYRDTRGLYLPDETHLNAKGYHVLDSCLAVEILKDRKMSYFRAKIPNNS